ncbi:MAG: hypothetical protein QOE83_2770 [Actinomycetota bacterium]|jgi:hypothetical protein|nr:hypothetical protein [Actinomycetota bacterium]
MPRKKADARDLTSPFDRRWRWLAHPIFLASVATLAINDHVLKGHYPSWWTGKLSDIAGVVVVGMLAAVLLGVRRGLLLTGTGFVLLKTISGVGGKPVLDATDLVAVVFLIPIASCSGLSIGAEMDP